MSTWLEQKPIKNHWQPLPHQIALSPVGIGTLARGTKKKSLPGVKNNIFDNHFCVSRAGQSFKPKSAICFLFSTQRPWSSPRALS
jgi:hypothetical protein